MKRIKRIKRIKIVMNNYKNGAGDGNRTREGTNPLGPQPSAFDRSTTPALKIALNSTVLYNILIILFKSYYNNK